MKTLNAIDFVAPVVQIGREATVGEAARLMDEQGVGCLVVTDGDGRAVGVVTDRDLAVRCIAGGCGAEEPVGRVHSAPVISARPEEDFDEVIQRMRSSGVRRLPVLDGEGRAQALISFDDLLGILSLRLASLSSAIEMELTKSGKRPSADEPETALQHLLHRLQIGRWKVNEAILAELDEIRARLTAR